MPCFFAAEEHEAYGPLWAKAREMDVAGRLNNQRRIAAIVEGSGAEFERIEVCA